MTYFHGTTVDEIESGAAPLVAGSASTIVVVGCAAGLDTDVLAYDTPTRIRTKAEAAALWPAVMADDMRAVALPLAASILFAEGPVDLVVIRAKATYGTVVVTGTAAPATFALVNNQTLVLTRNGEAQTVTFVTADFVAIGAATIDEVVAAINDQVTGITASSATGALRLTAAAVADVETTLHITGSAAATALSLPSGDAAPGELNASSTQTAVVGGVSGGGVRSGISAIEVVEEVTGRRPGILVAPYFSQESTVRTALHAAAEAVRAVTYVDGPDTTVSAATTAASALNLTRAAMCDPHALVDLGLLDTAPASVREDGGSIDVPSSILWAAAQALRDGDPNFGPTSSASNYQLRTVTGNSRPVSSGTTSSDANTLNEGRVGTIIRSPEGGFVTWGNFSLAGASSRWRFLAVRRTADLVNEAIRRGHQWAMDRNITRDLIAAAIVDRVQDFGDSLVARDRIAAFRAYPSPDLNTDETLADGSLYVDYTFTPYLPLDQLVFRSIMTTDGLAEIVLGE
jgi:phage tail sheath protein FI